MMTITIYYSEILFDLQNKNREEVRGITDPQARYLAEAGSEKIEEVARCIQESVASVSAMLLRFMPAQATGNESDMLSGMDDAILVLEPSERRWPGKAKAIADVTHSLIVNMSLSKYYGTINQNELADKRNKLASSDVAILNKLLYEKLPPVYPTITEENEQVSNNNDI